MSWKPEVKADSSGTWCSNGVAFATANEAEAYALDLKGRWLLVTDTRVVESSLPPNYKWNYKKGLEIINAD